MGMLVIKVIVLVTIIFMIIIFVLKKVLFDTTQGAVNRLDKETETVRSKQTELNEKIKQANEELTKRRAEADALVVKMKTEAEEKAREEREKIVKKARAEGEEILMKAQNTKDEMRKEIEKEMQIKVIDFCSIVIKEMWNESTIHKLNNLLIEEFLEQLVNVDMEMITDDITSSEVVSPFDLEKKYKEKLSEILLKKLERNIEIEEKVDPKLLGGIILQFGSLKLDGSLISSISHTGLVVKEKIERGMISIE